MFTEITITIIYIYNVFKCTLECVDILALHITTTYSYITLTRITLFLYYNNLNTHKNSYALCPFYTLITPKLLFMQITKITASDTHTIKSLFHYFPQNHTNYYSLCFTPNLLQTNINHLRLIRLSSLLCLTDKWFNNTLFHNDL